MTDKHIVIKDLATVELLNRVKADLLQTNPTLRITDELTVKTALSSYLKNESGKGDIK